MRQIKLNLGDKVKFVNWFDGLTYWGVFRCFNNIGEMVVHYPKFTNGRLLWTSTIAKDILKAYDSSPLKFRIL